MNSVEESRVIIKCFRERFEQIRGAHHICNAPECITLKGNRSIRTDRIRTSCETTISHIVLHDLDHIARCLCNTSNFIKRNTIPVAYKAYSTRRHVVERIGNRGRTTTHQDRIRGKFAVCMRFTGTSGSKLNQIIIFLDERHKAKQVMQFFLLR